MDQLTQDSVLQLVELVLSSRNATPALAARLTQTCKQISELLRSSPVVALLRDQSLLASIAMPDGKTATARTRMLLAQGAAVLQPDGAGSTPLHTAATQGHPAIAALLLRQGSLIDARDHAGRTPLFIACQVGHISFSQLLLGARANADLGNLRGVRPWQVACSEGHTQMVNLLLSANLPAGGEVLLHLYGLGTGTARRAVHTTALTLGSGLYHTAVEVRCTSLPAEHPTSHPTLYPHVSQAGYPLLCRCSI